MKFRCEKDILTESVSTASRVVSTRGGALPVLSGIRLQLTGNKLQIAATDLDISVQTEIEVSGIEDGEAVIPARLFSDITKSLEPGAVTVEVGDEAVISSAKSEFKVRTLPAAEFPKIPEAEGQPVKINAQVFGDALKQVVRAASTSDDRPMLTGVLVTSEGGGLRLVATDSYRLALRDIAGASILSEGQKVLIPSKALAEIQKLADKGEVEIRLGERDASFTVGSTYLSTRLIDGEFPNYRQLIPQGYPNRLTVKREVLQDAVRRVKLLVRDAMTPVRVKLSTSAVELSVVSQEIGQANEEIDGKYEGSELSVAFNPTYLLDGIDALESEEIIIETVDALKPALLRSSDNSEYTYLLMPVRVS